GRQRRPGDLAIRALGPAAVDAAAEDHGGEDRGARDHGATTRSGRRIGNRASSRAHPISAQNATTNISHPENVCRNPSAACGPTYDAARPVPATRAALATIATGIVSATTAIRAQRRGPPRVAQ